MKLNPFPALACALMLTTPLVSQTPAPDPHAVPTLDGGIGSCAADLTVEDSAGAPIYLAKINVHIAYGFLNKRRLDLELSTNVDGRARFTGLPDRLKHGIYFRASSNGRSGEAFDDPANTCKAQFTITLQPQASAPPAAQP
jgi:hypothetical protein